MKKPKPLSVIGKLRLERKQHEETRRVLAEREQDILHLQARLSEARRRTLPIAGGHGDINFLPVFIKDFEMLQDAMDLTAEYGVFTTRELVVRRKLFKVTVIASMLDPDAPVVFPAKAGA